MANKPIKEFSKGKVKVALWKGEYENSFSFSIQKSYLDKDKKWQNTQYLTEPDLRDLGIIINSICASAVKSRVIEQKPQQETQEDPQAQDDQVPF